MTQKAAVVPLPSKTSTIEPATVTSLLMHLDGFRVDQENVAALFDGRNKAAAVTP